MAADQAASYWPGRCRLPPGSQGKSHPCGPAPRLAPTSEMEWPSARAVATRDATQPDGIRCLQGTEPGAMSCLAHSHYEAEESLCTFIARIGNQFGRRALLHDQPLVHE